MWKGVFIIIVFLFSVDGKAQDQYKVNASVLNVRSLPSTQGAKKGVLYKDAIVDVYEFSKDSSWAHIRSNSLNGWVYRKYLEPITPIETVIETSNQQDIETQIINFIEKYYYIPKNEMCSFVNPNVQIFPQLPKRS
ncbi:MAG: SH3 domain-containing protein [Bacteroidales bacterium]|nr:SH3 domain-containing protein [Bacteroidales bacterium]